MLPTRVDDRAVALATGAAAAATGLAAMVATQDGHLHASYLVKISVSEPLAALARRADPHFRLVNGTAHYDGAYYYAVAREPLLRGKAHTLIDEPAYRYGHPLHGWLAWLLSAGRPGLVPLALLVLGLAGLAVAAWAVSRIAVLHGRSPWSGLVVAVSPGLLFAASDDTTETVGAAIVACAFLCWTTERYRLATVLFVAACLDKEPYLVVPAGLAGWELVQAWRRRAVPRRLPTMVTAVVAGPVALFAWSAYVHHWLHRWPWHNSTGNFGRPFAGWRAAFRYATVLSRGSFDQSQIGTADTPFLVATAALIVLAAVAALRVRTVFALPLLLAAAVTSCQGFLTLVYPHELYRTPAVTVLLAIAVLLARPAPVVPPRIRAGSPADRPRATEAPA